MVSRSAGIRKVWSVLLSVVLAAALSAPATAHADPLNTEPGSGDQLGLPWTALGLPQSFTLAGANVNQDFTVPVPAGLTVARLRGLIHAPIDFGAGFVEIDDSRGTLLATVDLPPVAPNTAVVPFDVDVSQAQVIGTTARLSFTVREAGVSPEQRCGLGERVQISDLSAVYAGIEPAPSTIAGFFPPVLQRLTIYTPIDADTSEEQAALTLASAAARLYRPQPTAITVVKQPRGSAPPAAPQLTRAIVVENGDAGLTVANPDRADVYLKVSGRGDQLSDQVSLAVNNLQSLAQVPTARVDQAGSAGGPDADALSFADLNITGETQVLRTADLTVGVDRSALGGRVDGLQMDLLATYTPVMSQDAAALMVSVNDQAVYSAPLDTSGRIDATFDVPGEFLKQRITVTFGLTYSPRQLCNPMIAPLTFQLDPRSTITATRGGQAGGGFGAVPSELSPQFLVALDGSSPDQLDYAARVVADMARQSGTPMMPRVVDVKAAAEATTGALIVANAKTLEPTSLRPPVGGPSSDVAVDLRDELRAEINDGLGSIQVFADQPRNRTVVLVTSSGAWSLVDPLFGYIDAQPGGWASLTGNVLAAGAAGAVTNLAVASADDAAAPADEPVNWALWVAIGVGCVALLAAMAVGVGVLLRRRRSPSAK
ncbi:cellulose biosynthesis cyclic di-GMP-binding regulatory protein BcsB [Mycobacterium sp. C3-094]